MFTGNNERCLTWGSLRASRRGRLLGVLPLAAEILGARAALPGPQRSPGFQLAFDMVPPNPAQTRRRRIRDVGPPGACCTDPDSPQFCHFQTIWSKPATGDMDGELPPSWLPDNAPHCQSSLHRTLG